MNTLSKVLAVVCSVLASLCLYLGWEVFKPTKIVQVIPIQGEREAWAIDNRGNLYLGRYESFSTSATRVPAWLWQKMDVKDYHESIGLTK